MRKGISQDASRKEISPYDIIDCGNVSCQPELFAELTIAIYGPLSRITSALV